MVVKRFRFTDRVRVCHFDDVKLEKPRSQLRSCSR